MLQKYFYLHVFRNNYFKFSYNSLSIRFCWDFITNNATESVSRCKSSLNLIVHVFVADKLPLGILYTKLPT
jgi:hypothetical protein